MHVVKGNFSTYAAKPLDFQIIGHDVNSKPFLVQLFHKIGCI